MAWWIPPAFICVCGIISIATHIRINQMSEFLQECEEALGHRREIYLRPKWPLFTVTTALAWIVMPGSALYGSRVCWLLSNLPYCIPRA